MYFQEANDFRFADLKIGQSETLGEGINVTVEMLQAFKNLSGDVSPCHVDEEFATSKGFKGQVVYGMLSASFYSTLVGVFLPGKYALFQKADIDFSKPVYVGDTLTVSGKITEMSEAVRQITIKAEIRNQNGERVSKARLEVGLTE